ncbi:MAG: ATP-binding protein [Acidimicrobiales bacterium]
MIRRALWDACHPPLRDVRFWVVQVLVVAIAGMHLVVDQAGLLRTTPFPASETVGLLLVPVAYAAAAFGLGPSVATALWAWVVWTPDLLLPRDQGQPYADLVELTLITAVAVLVGFRIERERTARAAAEQADADHRAAEHRYRSLLDAHVSPTLVVDETGTVVLANPAARLLFGDGVTGSLAASLGIEMDGRARTEPAADHTSRHAGRRLVVGAGDGARELRVESTVVTGLDASGLEAVQVVLHDVTSETREGRDARAFASDLVEVQEEERRRISQELHDEPVQRLVRLSQRLLAAEEAAARSANAEAVLPASIRTARSEALEVIAELRALARGLRPPVLDDLGLVAAVQAFLDEPGGTTVRSLVVDGTPRRLTSPVELALFRIVQESVRNAERHSGATAVDVTMTFTPEACRVTVADDGSGFAADAPRGLGLLGMGERAEAVGARLEVGPGPSGGTTVTVAVAISGSISGS